MPADRRRPGVALAVAAFYVVVYTMLRPTLLHGGWGVFVAALALLNVVALAALCWALRMRASEAVAGMLAVLMAAGALVAGGMFAGCDVNMRPFIIEMIVFFMPITIAVNPLFGGAFVVLSAGAGFGARTARARSARVALTLTAIVLLPFLALGSFAFARLHGVHPVPGNCVL